MIVNYLNILNIWNPELSFLRVKLCHNTWTTYTILLLTWKTFYNQAPAYLKELIITPYSPVRRLRSYSDSLLEVPRTIGWTSWKSLVPLVGPPGSPSYHGSDVWGPCLLGCCSKTLECATRLHQEMWSTQDLQNPIKDLPFQKRFRNWLWFMI